MKKNIQLSSHELQLLSGYLDGELSKKDKNRVEQLLADHPETESFLEKIRHIKNILKLLPIRKVPGNFTLTAKQSVSVRTPSFVGVLRYASAVSAVLLVGVLVLDFLSPFGFSTEDQSIARSAVETTAEEKMVSPDEEIPIITWGKPAPFDEKGYGLGGGGTGAPELQEELPQAEGDFAPDVNQTEALQPQLEEALADETEELLLPEEEQQPSTDGEKFMQGSDLSESASGPILGIRPSEDQGSIEPFEEISQPLAEEPVYIPLRMIEIVLAGLAVAAAITANFLRRRGQ